MTTIRMSDVAERAGVSVKTVSNVLNGYPHITARTRAKVQAAIAELDYKPNVSARSLRKGRVGVIALAVPELATPYYARVAAAVSRAAKRQGVAVLIEQTDGERAAERLVLAGLRDLPVDGIIFSPTPCAALLPSGPARPVVLLGERHSASLDTVALDFAQAAYDATVHLLGLGRRHVAVIGGSPHAEQRQGYRTALRAAGIVPEPAWEQTVDDAAEADRFRRRDGDCCRPAPDGEGVADRDLGAIETGAAAMRHLLELPRPPDAVLCCDDLLAVGALRTLAGSGLSAPADVAVMGFGGVADGRYNAPSLSTVSPDKERLAEEAVRLLLDRIAGNGPPGNCRLTVPHSLRIRDSTVPATGRPAIA